MTAAIVFVHFALRRRDGLEVYVIDRYMQFLSPEWYGEGSWSHLLHFHANPPGLTVAHYALEKLSSGHRYAAWGAALIALHVISFLFFHQGLKARGLRDTALISAVLFLNPLMFAYFNYPFYAPLSFLLACGLVRVSAPDVPPSMRLAATAIALSLGGLLRATWHLVFVAALCLPLAPRTARWARITALYAIAALTCLYLKNYILFDRFAAATLIGLNTARYHVPEHRWKETALAAGGDRQPVNRYRKYIDGNDPRVGRLPMRRS